MSTTYGIPIRDRLLLLSLYVTQALGIGFLLSALTAILRSSGASLHYLSIVYLFGLFKVFKFIWAPLIDRYTLPHCSHHKGWLLLFQSLLVIMLVLLSCCNTGSDRILILMLGFLISFFSSSLEVCADGLACRLLPYDARGLGNGIKTAGSFLGFMIGGGILLMSYPQTGWTGSLLILALLTALAFPQLLFFQEPDIHPSSQQYANGYLKGYFSFWRGRGVWLFLILVYPTGLGMAYAILLPLLVDSGWSLVKISLVVNVYGLLIGTMTSMAAGWFIRRMGRRQVLLGIAGALGIGILLLLLPAAGYHDLFSVSLAIGVLFVLYGPAMTVMSTLMMDQSSPHAPATEFAMQHSLFHLMSHISSALGLAAAGWAGYPAIIIAASTICFIALGVAMKGYAQIEMTACDSQA